MAHNYPEDLFEGVEYENTFGIPFLTAPGKGDATCIARTGSSLPCELANVEFGAQLLLKIAKAKEIRRKQSFLPDKAWEFPFRGSDCLVAARIVGKCFMKQIWCEEFCFSLFDTLIADTYFHRFFFPTFLVIRNFFHLR